MNNEYNQQLKQLFRSNTIVNIKLGISLALSQGYSWNYIAEKCLEEWLLFDRYKEYGWGCNDYCKEFIYGFTPNECLPNKAGACWFSISIYPNEILKYQSRAQLYLDDGFIDYLEKKIKVNSPELLKAPAINKMEEFLKLIYNNEHDL